MTTENAPTKANVTTVDNLTKVPVWRAIKSKGTPPSPRSGHSVVVHKDRLYVFGGRDGNTFKSDIFVFHFDTSTWEEITTSGARPLPRYGHKAVVFDGKMIVFGGHAATTYLNDLLALDLETHVWERVEGGGQSPTPRWQHSMVVWGSEVIIFGGCDSSAFVNDIYAFNFEHNFWRAMPIDDYSIPPSPRMQHGAVVSGSRMYVFGGQSVDSVKNDMYEFNLELSTWTFLGVYEDVFRRNFTCTQYMGNILIFGGYSGGLHNDLIQYNTETGAWSQFENFGGTPPSKRSGHGGDRYGSKMIVFGGLANSGSQNDLYELDLGDLVDEQATVSEPDIAFSPPTINTAYGSSPIEFGYLHRMRNGTSDKDPLAFHNREDTPLLALCREEIQKLRSELEAMRQENMELKREIMTLKAEKAALAEESAYILI